MNDWKLEFYEFGNENHWDWDGAPERIERYVKKLLHSELNRHQNKIVNEIADNIGLTGPSKVWFIDTYGGSPDIKGLELIVEGK